jgi:hypothetical protein
LYVLQVAKWVVVLRLGQGRWLLLRGLATGRLWWWQKGTVDDDDGVYGCSSQMVVLENGRTVLHLGSRFGG